MLTFLLMLALESVFGWLLLSRRRVGKEISATNRLEEQETKRLHTTPARTLTEPASSVIEQTTNQLKPIFTERKSK
jgi:hypothetical protein